MNRNILLCGVGGQGTVLASKLIAKAAMEKGLKVMSAETIGMAQRGGSVYSYIRIGDDVCTPMIKKKNADIIIAFEPGEAVRMLPYLKEDGYMIVSSEAVVPVTSSLSDSKYNANDMIMYLKKHINNLMIVDTNSALKSIGSTKVLNILLLGAAVKTGKLGLEYDDVKNVILNKIPQKFHEINFKALEYISVNN